MIDCLFCRIQQPGYEKEIVDENEFFIATRDSYPVTPLHTLIIPRRHFASYFEMNEDEQATVFDILKSQRNQIQEIDPTVTGFNVGCNDGTDAGQSIFHLHFQSQCAVGRPRRARAAARAVSPLRAWHHTNK